MNAEPQLLIFCEGHRAHLTVQGAVAVPQAVALKRFYVNAILEGFTDFTLECAECTAMDSTFLGTLTGMALRLKKRAANSARRTCGWKCSSKWPASA